MESEIRIDDVPFHQEFGSPTIDFWPRTPQTTPAQQLAKLHLSFRTDGADAAEQVEELLKRDTVTVVDPFRNRQYQATIEKIFGESTGGDNWERRYLIDVTEVPS